MFFCSCRNRPRIELETSRLFMRSANAGEDTGNPSNRNFIGAACPKPEKNQETFCHSIQDL